MQLFLKILSGMASSVDPDQTASERAVWSGSTLFAYAILSGHLVFKILGHLLYFSYFMIKAYVVEYSLEASEWGISYEYSQCMLHGELRKIFTRYLLLSVALPSVHSLELPLQVILQSCTVLCYCWEIEKNISKYLFTLEGHVHSAFWQKGMSWSGLVRWMHWLSSKRLRKSRYTYGTIQRK